MTASDKLAHEILDKARSLLHCAEIRDARVNSVESSKREFGRDIESVSVDLGNGASMAITIFTEENKK